MILKCIAIDDEPLALELLRDYIARVPELRLLQTFEDAISGAGFLRSHEVDLLFIDVNMPDVTGLDLVRSLEKKPMVIFTTAHRKFALEGFDLEAVDYLLKPIAFARFGRAAKRAIEFAQYRDNRPPPTGELYVRSEYKLVRIPLRDVEYIESLEDYVRFHLADQPAVMTLMTMKSLTEKLPPAEFTRIHRRYIVARSKIRSVVNRKVTLISGAELPVGESYLGDLPA